MTCNTVVWLIVIVAVKRRHVRLANSVRDLRHVAGSVRWRHGRIRRPFIVTFPQKAVRRNPRATLSVTCQMWKSRAAKPRRRTCLGVAPIIRRNVRVKCAASEKPAAYAASATDVPRASSRAPHCKRNQSTYGRSGTPTDVVNRCRNRDEDNPASAAQLAAVTGSPQNRPIWAIDRTTRGSSERGGNASPKHMVSNAALVMSLPPCRCRNSP